MTKFQVSSSRFKVPGSKFQVPGYKYIAPTLGTLNFELETYFTSSSDTAPILGTLNFELETLNFLYKDSHSKQKRSLS
jgi:hypothetical protein